MNYIEYNFNIQPKEPSAEILTAFLSELPFDTFIDSENGFLTYVGENETDIEEEIKNVLNNPIFDEVDISYQTQLIEDRNWNEEWEKDFDPIIVEDKVYIKANFHPEKDYPYTIKIQPKMAFGTGHHETTYLMIQMMNSMDFQGKSVLDMGAGTAILAIYAKMKGAKYVEAIDIDEWAYDNAIENVELNNMEIEVKIGDANILQSQKFNTILANINKNILIQDIPTYVVHLEANGELLLSGIYESDFDDINAVCVANGLIFEQKKQKNEWISILYTKTKS